MQIAISVNFYPKFCAPWNLWTGDSADLVHQSKLTVLILAAGALCAIALTSLQQWNEAHLQINTNAGAKPQRSLSHRMPKKLKYSSPEHFPCPSQRRSSHSMLPVPVATRVFKNHAIKCTNKNRQEYSFQFLAITCKWLRECVAKRMWKQNKKEDFWQNPNRTEKKKNRTHRQ